jgi:hypothetical protein
MPHFPDALVGVADLHLVEPNTHWVPADSGPPAQQCGRCRLLFEGDPTLHPAAPTGLVAVPTVSGHPARPQPPTQRRRAPPTRRPDTLNTPEHAPGGHRPSPFGDQALRRAGDSPTARLRLRADRRSSEAAPRPLGDRQGRRRCFGDSVQSSTACSVASTLVVASFCHAPPRPRLADHQVRAEDAVQDVVQLLGITAVQVGGDPTTRRCDRTPCAVP